MNLSCLDWVARAKGKTQKLSDGNTPILSLTIVAAVAGKVSAHWRVLWGALRLGKTPVNSIPRDWIDERAVAYHGADTRADQDRRELHQMTLCARASGRNGRGRRRCTRSWSAETGDTARVPHHPDLYSKRLPRRSPVCCKFWLISHTDKHTPCVAQQICCTHLPNERGLRRLT